MRVILLRNVDGLGREGEIKDVSAGYARNFLLPRQLADIATPDLTQQLEGRRKHQERKAKQVLGFAQHMASDINGKRFEIWRKASQEGTLYAAVNNIIISDELKKRGFSIEPENIITKGIKEIGEHEIVIRFNHGIEAKIQLIINQSKQ